MTGSLKHVAVRIPSAEALARFCTESSTSSSAELIALGYSLVLHRFLDLSSYLYSCEGVPTHEPRDAACGQHRVLVRFEPESTVLDALAVIKKALVQLGAGGVPSHATISTGDTWTTTTTTHRAFLPQQIDGSGSKPNSSQSAQAFALLLTPESIDANGCGAELQYNTDIFSQFQAQNIANALGRALQCILTESTPSSSGTSPAGPLAAVDLFSPQDHATVNRWNLKRPVASQECVPDLVERVCQRHPHELAVVSSFDGVSMTYARLNELATRLACHLVKKYRLGRGAIVPLCLDKSALVVVAMLAVLKTGAAYCCLDPQHPRARHDFILQSVKAPFVMASANHQTLFSLPVLVVDSALAQQLGQEAQDTGALLQPSCGQKQPGDTCIVGFSSGSTGVPKGVIHTHQTLTTGLLQNGPRHGLNQPGIRVFQWCAYTFDVSVTEIWGTLICGGTICIPSEHERLNDVESAMKRMGVQWAFFTPSFARFFCRQGYRVDSLQTLAMGGEALNKQDAHMLLDELALERVLHVFGPAESITWFLKPLSRGAEKPRSGKELAEYMPFLPSDAHCWIVDPDDVDRLAPVGAIGELLIEGPALFTGYLNDAARTGAALITPPRWRSSMDIGQPVFKIYRSGDLVRYVGNGEMRYVSRKDGVVKLRGQLVDLGEIESLLRANISSFQGEVDIAAQLEPETAVLLVKEGSVPFMAPGDQALVAFINPRDKQATKQRSESLHTIATLLQAQLRKRVPEYMVPRLFYPVDHFPYNASRKLDRKALTLSVPTLNMDHWLRLSGPAPSGDSPGTKAGLEAGSKETHGQTSELLKRAWLDVFGMSAPDFSPEDDFFQRGGNSMLAMELVAAARRHGVSISVANIFQYPVFGQLVAAANINPRVQKALAQEESTGTATEVPPFALLGSVEQRDVILKQSLAQCRGLALSDIEDILPATPLQTEFVASGLRRPGTFVAQAWLEIPANVSVARFQRVWKQLNANFPSLRCRMVQVDAANHGSGIFRDFQVLISPERALDWTMDDKGTGLDEYLARDRATPMGYGDALARYAVLNTSPEAGGESKKVMVLTMHQCIYEGVIVKRLHEAMIRLLNQPEETPAISKTRMSPSPPIAPFIKYISSHAGGQAARSFWQNYFSGYGSTKQSPFPALPDPSYTPEADSLFAKTIQLPSIGPNPKHITLPTIILAAWALLMNHFTGNTDIVLPMLISGRGIPVPGIMDMPYPTTAKAPVRVQLPPAVLELLASGPADARQPDVLQDFLQALQADQIQLATTACGHTGLAAIATYGGPCRLAADVCRNHPQGSLDIQYATATFRPTAGAPEGQQGGDQSARVDVAFQVNVQDAKYFSPEDALTLGCYVLDGDMVRLVFVYDSGIIRRQQVAEYSALLEGFLRSLILGLGGYSK